MPTTLKPNTTRRYLRVTGTLLDHKNPDDPSEVIEVIAVEDGPLPTNLRHEVECALISYGWDLHKMSFDETDREEVTEDVWQTHCEMRYHGAVLAGHFEPAAPPHMVERLGYDAIERILKQPACAGLRKYWTAPKPKPSKLFEAKQNEALTVQDLADLANLVRGGSPWMRGMKIDYARGSIAREGADLLPSHASMTDVATAIKFRYEADMSAFAVGQGRKPSANKFEVSRLPGGAFQLRPAYL